jgi:lipopolysaccharide transport system ATP-binding protein
MPDIVVSASGLTKAYPLTASTRRRLLYVLGFGRSGDVVARKEAVSKLDLEIRRGEKVGIVGRNGSGKSTLLGMISGTIQPTEGRLTVHGSIHALLQLGAGFNDELTGRENAYSYLAMQGLAGAEAEARVADIEDFAEIGVYFDQPVKTYSSGMRLRLMFAASTAVTPDILILDEVLSVGDAYFVGKSFDRMRDLCAGDGTTLIVVSHAVNSLPELCDRIVWIDSGVVRMDGDAVTVARAYDHFVRGEEENRLRKLQAALPVRQLARLPGERTEVAAQSGGGLPDGIVGELRMPDGQPPRERLTVRRIELLQGGETVADIRISADAGARDGVLLTARGAGNWGDWEAGPDGGRRFLPYGAPFHKLPFLVTRPNLRQALDTGGVVARLACSSATATDIDLVLFAQDPSARWRARLPVSGAGARGRRWRRWSR